MEISVFDLKWALTFASALLMFLTFAAARLAFKDKRWALARNCWAAAIVLQSGYFAFSDIGIVIPIGAGVSTGIVIALIVATFSGERLKNSNPQETK